MYFSNRAEAGKMLAEKLTEYRKESVVVVSLGMRSTIVAAQVAMKLHSNLLLYIVKGIKLPGEHINVAGLGSGDVFTFNDYFSQGELNEIQGEYHNYIDQMRMQRLHELHSLMGADGEINKNLLRRRVVIVVSDGMPSAFALSVVSEFFNHIAIRKLVIATPVASVEAVDQMHMMSDGVCCLSVVDSSFDTDHYYEDNTRPDINGVKKIMRNISINWQDSSIDANVYTLPEDTTPKTHK